MRAAVNNLSEMAMPKRAKRFALHSRHGGMSGEVILGQMDIEKEHGSAHWRAPLYFTFGTRTHMCRAASLAPAAPAATARCVFDICYVR